MRALFGVLLSLPLSMMLMGLAAAWVPVPWNSWLVLLWMSLSLLVALPEKAWPPLVGLLVANGIVWATLQTTGIYGGAA